MYNTLHHQACQIKIPKKSHDDKFSIFGFQSKNILFNKKYSQKKPDKKNSNFTHNNKLTFPVSSPERSTCNV